MQKWQSGSKRNAARVQALFGQIRAATLCSAGAGWLDVLERDAKSAKAGWRDRFDAWLLGQEQAGGVPAALAEQWRHEADACHTTIIRPEPVAFCLLWTVLVTLATLGWQSSLVGPTQAIVGCATIALTGVIWAYRVGWMLTTQRWWERGLIAFVVGAGAICLGILAPAFYSNIAQEGAYKAFKRQQNEFTTASTGYPWVRDFAWRAFGVDVVINAPAQTWARATLQTMGTSPAIMSTGNGLCELTISRESILNGFARPAVPADDVWVQGVMMHELAHCLDVRRDYAGQGGAWTGTRSISPVDRHDVSSGPAHYRIASEREPTQLWREALADIMAVGYWRLNASPAEWRDLTATLREKRLTSRRHDTVHATMCWIDLAASADGPASNRELFAWADGLRSASSCKTAPGKYPGPGR